MRNLTVSEVEGLEEAHELAVPLQMDEDAFRAFYDRTARTLWLYLTRMTSDRSHVDDLFQETYYRFLRANRTYESEEHRRSYLFRIATNLVTDGYRRRAGAPTVQLPPEDDAAVLRTPGDEGERAADRTDLTRAMASLRSRDRALLWLAYGQGASHVEIAGALGLQTSSIKSLLYRARGRLARLLQRDVRSGSARERTRR